MLTFPEPTTDLANKKPIDQEHPTVLRELQLLADDNDLPAELRYSMEGGLPGLKLVFPEAHFSNSDGAVLSFQGSLAVANLARILAKKPVAIQLYSNSSGALSAVASRRLAVVLRQLLDAGVSEHRVSLLSEIDIAVIRSYAKSAKTPSFSVILTPVGSHLNQKRGGINSSGVGNINVDS